MSKISVVYDKLREIVPTIVTARQELINPYDLANNPRPFLQKGWGILIGDAVPSKVSTYCLDIEARSFIIVLVDHLVSLGNSHDPMALGAKNLMEDIRLLKNRLVDYDQLSIHESIEQIKYASGTGIDFLKKGETSYLISSLTVSIDYSEQI